MHQVLIVSNLNIINNHIDQETLSLSNSKNDYSLCPMWKIILYLYILNCTDKRHWLFPMTRAKMNCNYSVCHHIHVLYDKRCHNKFLLKQNDCIFYLLSANGVTVANLLHHIFFYIFSYVWGTYFVHALLQRNKNAENSLTFKWSVCWLHAFTLVSCNCAKVISLHVVLLSYNTCLIQYSCWYSYWKLLYSLIKKPSELRK